MPLTPRRPKAPKSKPLAIERCPEGIVPTDDAVYVGSPEHKTYVNPVSDEPPSLRSDASRCESYPRDAWCRFTTLLRVAIELRCANGWDAEGRPKYVWGWCDGRAFQARRRTDPPGNKYKAWWIEPGEMPRDPDGTLERLRAELERRRV